MSILNERNAKIMALPTSPQAIPLLTRLAQQPDPSNPMQQTLALMKLNEIKRLESAAQMAQAPQGTVKDQTVQQLAQNMGGVAQLQNARAQQGIQQIAQQASAQGPAPANTGEPVQAARGGLMSLPVKRYAAGSPGGVDSRNSDPDYVDRIAILNQELRKATAAGRTEDIAALTREIAHAKKTYVPTKYTPQEQAQRATEQKASGLPDNVSRLGIPLGNSQAPRIVDASTAPMRGTPAPTGSQLRAVDALMSGANDTDTPTPTPAPPAPAPATPNALDMLRSAFPDKPPEEDRSGVNAQRQALLAKYSEMQDAAKAAGDQAQLKFNQDEQARSSDSMWKALMAAGEATRGRKGLGGLAAGISGYGQSIIGAREAERARAKDFAVLAETRRQAQEQIALKAEELKLAHLTGDADRAAAAQKDLLAAKQKLAEILFKEQSTDTRNAATIAGHLATQELQNQGALANTKLVNKLKMQDYAARYNAALKQAQREVEAIARTVEGSGITIAQREAMIEERTQKYLQGAGVLMPQGNIAGASSAPTQRTYDLYATKE